MAKIQKGYEAPSVHFLKFDANDILRTSDWNFNCQSYGGGNDADPMACDIEIHTDNSLNN